MAHRAAGCAFVVPCASRLGPLPDVRPRSDPPWHSNTVWPVDLIRRIEAGQGEFLLFALTPPRLATDREHAQEIADGQSLVFVR